MNKLFASGAVLLAFTAPAFADDNDGDGFDDITGESVEATTTSADTSSTSSDSSSDSAPAAASGEGPKMGIETSLNGVGAVPVLHLLYNIGGNYLDAIFGFGFTNQAPDVGDSVTQIDLSIGAGYRMYKEMDGRIHPYIEPYVNIQLQTDSTPMSDPPTSIGLGAQLGVDYQLFEQFTVGAALGAELDYTITDAVNTFDFGLYTTSINATFWWG